MFLNFPGPKLTVEKLLSDWLTVSVFLQIEEVRGADKIKLNSSGVILRFSANMFFLSDYGIRLQQWNKNQLFLLKS